ncbi:tryptophan 2,3-dioxygenase family protein [Pseudolysinimonas kribbensis]|uniref:Tryptophan 2,3-dioxygenase n=1 Tax=Pseudolysinimonas kribbensis TaxID=433641 RepID=A0ABQ6K4F4_9MICO|nr:tryptophan 2,3-dioxygenase [Pseudolysinimonas kribbensis]GMA95219.1 tryptophan 2,3-dioxygenase [Pseudolysinimonas kribbensis]
MTESNTREFEATLVTDLRDKMTYGDYLDLDTLLGAQHPLSRPEHHDELLFIIQHQTTELWLKLVLHELRAACAALAGDNLKDALKKIARIKHIQRSMIEQWSVLATLTPTEYVQFRDSLAKASGFQSAQYRAVEFLLGNKNARMLEVFRGEPENAEMLREALEAPSLYDEFLRLLARRGVPIPQRLLERDVTVAHVFDPELRDVLARIYEKVDEHWDVYEACEELVDLEENFQLWRFRHMRTVMRTIGFKQGTGGSSGVDFLRRALDLTFFPELFALRTQIEAS